MIYFAYTHPLVDLPVAQRSRAAAIRMLVEQPISALDAGETPWLWPVLASLATDPEFEIYRTGDPLLIGVRQRASTTPPAQNDAPPA